MRNWGLSVVFLLLGAFLLPTDLSSIDLLSPEQQEGVVAPALRPGFSVSRRRPSSGRTIYVDSRARDGGTGTIKSPVRTISRAVELAREGDTVLITPGVYYESVFLNGGLRRFRVTTVLPEENVTGGGRVTSSVSEECTSGSRNAQNNVTYKSSVKGQYFIIDGTSAGLGFNGLGVVCGMEGIAVEGVEVRNWHGTLPNEDHPGGSGGKGIDVYQARDTTFRNFKLHDTSHGAKVSYAFNTIFDSCEVYNNGIPHANSRFSNQGHGLYLQGDGIVISNCKIHENGGVHGPAGTEGGGAGIQFWPPGGTEEGKIRNVQVFDNQIYQNAFGLQIDGWSENIMVRNNLFRDNEMFGLDVDSLAARVTVYNNLFKENPVNMRLFRRTNGSRVEVLNNLFYLRDSMECAVQIRSVESAGSISQFDFNAYWNDYWFDEPHFCFADADGNQTEFLDFDDWKGETGQDSHSLLVDPRLNIFFQPLYHLRSGSPLIDAGIYLGLPYLGEKPDIGAYEYGVVSGNP